MEECPHVTCFWPGATCNLGYVDPSECTVLKADSRTNQDDRPMPDAVSTPWSGGVFGLADLGFVAGRGKPMVLAIIGPQNAGKTTMLAAWYLLLGRGSSPEDELRFSGSYSLAGWEVVASFLRWEPGSKPPTFPPHTSSQSTRIPGLLHLAFKRDGDHRKDYVMTDAPGEWFRNWAVNRDSPHAEGARWAAKHADAFLLVADREALAGHERGAARTEIQLLARRLADELRGRPVGFVWTKTDIEITEDMERTVRSAVLRSIPSAEEFAVSIISEPDGNETGQELLHLLRWVLNVRRQTVRLPEPASDYRDPSSTFGAR